MSELSHDAEGGALADFRPLGNPEPPQLRPARESIENKHTYTPPAHPSADSSPVGPGAANFAPDTSGSVELSNYRRSYDAPPIIDDALYHVRRGAGGGVRSTGGDARVMEKLNYMIHMMEEQQHERTDHVMEEFILYTFLGIFIIFTVDSFSRIGKYTR